ncbi:MAG: helix-turn-helix domain-containing protein [Clostridiales bacterium]|nr:helix-turn-helix domain-containing protein [Clostridiales bacterium]
MLDFLWRQWSALGIVGGARTEDVWAIDPEALLIFSLEMSRYEPRLFDEVLDWMVVNGKWIDNQRLRGIIRHTNEKASRIISAVASFVSKEAGTYERKWRPLSSLHRYSPNNGPEALFRTKEGLPYPEPRNPSKSFLDYGFLRENVLIRKLTRRIPFASKSNIRFLLRALFGIGSRAECILYLLTHEAGHPSEIAKAIGISFMGARSALVDLSDSGLILTRIKGKRRIEYWVSQKRWWEFLYGVNYEEVSVPVWLDWISLFSALRNVWDVLGEVDKSESEYMRSSKLRESMETINREFVKSGLDVPPVPGPEVPPEKYEKEFQNFIMRVLGARNVSSR